MTTALAAPLWWATPPTRILRQGGIDNCDAVAAVSEDDSVNLMAAQIAKSIFRREKVICRVSDPHLQVLYHKAYEIDTICPRCSPSNRCSAHWQSKK